MIVLIPHMDAYWVLTVSFARYHLKLGAVRSIFSFVADVKKKKITKFTVKVSFYTFSKTLVVLFFELTSLLYF